jgi:hypothetical protein
LTESPRGEQKDKHAETRQAKKSSARTDCNSGSHSMMKLNYRKRTRRDFGKKVKDSPEPPEAVLEPSRLEGLLLDTLSVACCRTIARL